MSRLHFSWLQVGNHWETPNLEVPQLETPFEGLQEIPGLVPCETCDWWVPLLRGRIKMDQLQKGFPFTGSLRVRFPFPPVKLGCTKQLCNDGMPFVTQIEIGMFRTCPPPMNYLYVFYHLRWKPESALSLHDCMAQRRPGHQPRFC